MKSTKSFDNMMLAQEDALCVIGTDAVSGRDYSTYEIYWTKKRPRWRWVAISPRALLALEAERRYQEAGQ